VCVCVCGGGVDWNRVSEGMDGQGHTVNTIMNIRIP
jgi:hypothetical protein